jgi:type II secretory pathway component PulF
LFVSDVLDDENGQMLSTATKLLEPAILIGMGLMVGGIAMSLFVPLFDLAATSG